MKFPVEGPRKIVHALSLGIPHLMLVWPTGIRFLLVVTALFFVFLEWLKIRGHLFFLHRWILPLQRQKEKTRIAKAPILLACGLLFVSTFFEWKIFFVATFQVGFCDVMASVCGSPWGHKKVFYSPNKSYVGSFIFFLTAFPGTLLYYNWEESLILALAGMIMESLPLNDWDNLTIPVGVALTAYGLGVF